MDESASHPSGLSRRDMLRRTAAVLTGTIAATSALATLAPTRVWALELHTLSQADGETLLAFGQTLYPHATLPTAVYALLVKDLDAAAATDPAKAALLHDGTASLNGAAGGNFVAATPAARLAAATSIEKTAYFALVRSTCVTSLYNNEMAFKHFGYQGASWPMGGYIHRGFNDLTWLPNPPAAASPTVGVL
jgi:hypothetical protein